MNDGARTEASDDIERELTADGAPVRLRDKHIARTAAAVMVPGALLFLLAAVAVALGADPAAPRAAALVPFAIFAAMAWSAVANMVVRSAVTDRELPVRWGTRRFAVPLAAVTRCEARARGGGAGPAAGWALVAERGSVFVAWREGDAERKLLLPAHDPVALAAAIASARDAPTGVRVAAAGDATEAEVAAAEASPDGARAQGE